MCVLAICVSVPEDVIRWWPPDIGAGNWTARVLHSFNHRAICPALHWSFYPYFCGLSLYGYCRWHSTFVSLGCARIITCEPTVLGRSTENGKNPLACAGCAGWHWGQHSMPCYIGHHGTAGLDPPHACCGLFLPGHEHHQLLLSSERSVDFANCTMENICVKCFILYIDLHSICFVILIKKSRKKIEAPLARHYFSFLRFLFSLGSVFCNFTHFLSFTSGHWVSWIETGHAFIDG